MDIIRSIIIEKIKMAYSDKYLVNDKTNRNNYNINIDLHTTYPKNFHPVPYSLNRNGLIYLDITNNWRNFNRNSATAG